MHLVPSWRHLSHDPINCSIVPNLQFEVSNQIQEDTAPFFSVSSHSGFTEKSVNKFKTHFFPMNIVSTFLFSLKKNTNWNYYESILDTASFFLYFVSSLNWWAYSPTHKGREFLSTVGKLIFVSIFFTKSFFLFKNTYKSKVYLDLARIFLRFRFSLRILFLRHWKRKWMVKNH